MAKVDVIRHGDIMLVKAEGARGQMKSGKRLVLAEGEVTGHAHVLEGDLEFDQATEPTFVVVRGKATLTHQEHATVEVPAGTWQVVRQREHWGGEVRTVAD
jgi:hypothetical protein